MTLWSAEIKELEALYPSIKGQYTDLEKELEQLTGTEDANVILINLAVKQFNNLTV